RVLRVRAGAPPSGESADRYYAWLRTEFDNIADDYDHHITDNRMNLLLRNRSLARLQPLFAGRDPILEVGCGSGMETLPMLRAGHQMTVVDISDRMLDVVRAKADRAGAAERLHAVLSRARDLETLAGPLGPAHFAGAYCTYGALNCEAELEPVARGFARLLAPGAPLFLGVYNRWCLFELVGYGLTLRPERAFGRRGHPVRVGGSRFCVDVYAYTPDEVKSAFAPYFVPRALEGVPVLLPPSDLTIHADRFARRFETLAGWDARVGSWWPFRSLGDHFLLTLERTTTPVSSSGAPGRAAS
ncbi:MAG TPA: class I SAM-dependent methyltransferase, partial [Thermoplasmata archaeon]|nr:class I SAM-dependent methyltransferase [Thermoplasmata archaeon]